MIHEQKKWLQTSNCKTTNVKKKMAEHSPASKYDKHRQLCAEKLVKIISTDKAPKVHRLHKSVVVAARLFQAGTYTSISLGETPKITIIPLGVDPEGS
jgi:hypothetical protein